MGAGARAAASVRLRKRSSPGSPPTSWLLRTTCSSEASNAGVIALAVERQRAGGASGLLRVVRSISALEVGADFRFSGSAFARGAGQSKRRRLGECCQLCRAGLRMKRLPILQLDPSGRVRPSDSGDVAHFSDQIPSRVGSLVVDALWERRVELGLTKRNANAPVVSRAHCPFGGCVWLSPGQQPAAANSSF